MELSISKKHGIEDNSWFRFFRDFKRVISCGFLVVEFRFVLTKVKGVFPKKLRVLLQKHYFLH
jgi:hypothetical protein